MVSAPLGKQERSLLNRLKTAKLPYEWTLSSFPFKKQTGVEKSRIRSLAGLDFVKKGQNIVFIGKTGVGKTGLAVGLLRAALLDGYASGHVAKRVYSIEKGRN